MKRRKTVFTPHELVHIFISQSQDEGKTALKRASQWGFSSEDSGTNLYGTLDEYRQLYFEGQKIWAYGDHFLLGQLYQDNKVLLVNSEKTSRTTNEHRYSLINASSHLTTIILPHPEEPKHPENLKYLNEQVADSLESIFIKISGFLPSSWDEDKNPWNKRNFLTAFNNLEKYCKVFKIRNDLKLSQVENLIDEIISVKSVKEKARNEKREKTRQEKYRIIEKENEEKFRKNKIKTLVRLKNWRSKKDVYPSYGSFNRFKCCLRVRENEVETSHGAKVPLQSALRLYRAILKNEAKRGDDIGPYRFEKLEGSTIKIGCHDIELKEVHRVLGPYNNLELMEGGKNEAIN